MAGEVDLLTAPKLRQALTSAAGRSGSRLVLDLRQVSFLGSTGLGLLIETSRQVPGGAAGLRLVVDVPGAVFDVFAMAGLDKVFALCPTLEEALAHDSVPR